MDPKTILKNYIHKILELQDQNQTQSPLTEDELKSVAIDLGMDEGELAFIQQQFEDYKQRARGFGKYFNWEDAIVEYKQALTLNPIDRECLEEIATAYFENWKMYTKEGDKEGAIAYSRRLLNVDPDNEIGLKIISEIKTIENSQKEEDDVQKPVKWLVPGMLAVVALMIAGFLMNRYINNRPDEPGTAGQSEAQHIPKPPKEENMKLEIPVEVSKRGQKQDYQIQTLSSKIAEYDASFAYKAYGYVEADVEIEELKVKVSLLDGNGIPILFPEQFTLIRDHEANARPGDKIPWKMLIYEESKLESVVKEIKFEPSQIKLAPGAGSYPDAEDLGPVFWDMEKPKGHELIVRERRMNFTQSNFANKAYVRGEWELENTGQEKYKLIKIRFVWKGKAGQTESTTYALAEDFPFLLPGRKVPFGGTFEVGEHISRDFDGYEIHVSEWD